MQEMLSFTGSTAVVTLTFSRKTVPAHHSSQTIELLQCKSPKFIGPDLWTPNSQDFILIRLTTADAALGVASRNALWMMPIMNGVRDLRPE